MSENAIIAQRFILDLGPYAATLAFFAAWVAYRANPLRAVNRYFAGLLFFVGLWQVHVAIIRSTRNYQFWAPLAAPYGGIFIVLLLLMNDAANQPNLPFWQRVRRNPLIGISTALYCLGAMLAITAVRAPDFFPIHLRWTCVLLSLLILLRAEQRRRRGGVPINPNELTLFYLCAFFVSLVFWVYLLIRTPASSRILSSATVLFTTIVIAMLLSERVLDAKGTARVAFGYLLTVLLHALLMFIPLGVFVLAGGEFTPTVMWGFLLLGGLVSYPVFAFAQRTIRRTLTSLTARAAQEAREAAVEVAGRAESEAAIVQRVGDLSQSFLQGLDVRIELRSPQRHGAAEETGRPFLVARSREGWLSPEGALWRFGGRELDRVLETFREEQLGAVICHAGPRFTLVMFVQQRAGGSKPITSEELACLQELAAIAATGIERVRALEQAFRVHGMAEVGRVAAQFSHESRNQIEAILCVLEALRDGYEHRVTPAHRRAVYQQAVDLAANHNLALEMVRLRPERIVLQRTNLREVVVQSVAAFQNHRWRVTVAPDGAGEVCADARLLRQVLLNLFRNSVQAAGAAEPQIEVSFGRTEAFAFIEVADRGPGVSPEIHDNLFSRWTTTKQDGTGLGLAFCREAMTAMKGEIFYLTPKGRPGARFRLTLPALEVEAAPGHQAG